jgi:hypothetical protein
MYNGFEKLKELVGKKIQKIRMDEDWLVFETDKGNYAFTVGGDCCSHSFFYDFYGVKNLLQNGEVLEVEEIELDVPEYTIKPENDKIEAYGYRLTTAHEYWGKKSSVFSFRNDSNGYYGGWMDYSENYPPDVPEITDDTLL